MAEQEQVEKNKFIRPRVQACGQKHGWMKKEEG